MKTRTRHHLRALISLVGLAVLCPLLLPGAALAADKAPEPKEPFQRVIYSNGNWSAEYGSFDEKSMLMIGYPGSREIDPSVLTDPKTRQPVGAPPIAFTVASDTLLAGIYIPYTYPKAPEPGLMLNLGPGAAPPPPATGQGTADSLASMNPIHLQIQDARGNIFGPFQSRPNPVPELQSLDPSGRWISTRNADWVDQVLSRDLVKQDIVLRAGKYSLTILEPKQHVRNAETGPSGAILIKGIEYSAWKKYKEEVRRQEIADSPATRGVREDELAKMVMVSILGDQKLSDLRENPDRGSYTPEAAAAGARQAATISLQYPTEIQEIVFNTYNAGRGARPGTISVTGAGGKAFGSYQASGATIAGVPNAMWVAAPGVVLPAGDYALAVSDESVVARDSTGKPDFFVSVAATQPRRFNFTGTYLVDVDSLKTRTLAGPVTGARPESLVRGFEVSVLDKGDSLEFVGSYQGMSFSQNARVGQREENKLTALLEFRMDLSNLPYSAKIGAIANVTLENPSTGTPQLSIAGESTYQRSYTEKYGVDSNTSRVTGKGAMVAKELPAFVATALAARVPSVGNIPGPEDPGQGAVGALFPPLVGVLATLIQTMFRPKVLWEPPVSVFHGIPDVDRRTGDLAAQAMSEANKIGTQAMADANKMGAQAMSAANQIGVDAMSDANKIVGRALYDEKEARAWGMLADALAGSPDQGDADSVGDNEKPGGDDYVAVGAGDGDGGYSSGDEGGELAGGEPEAGGQEETGNGHEGYSPEDLKTPERFFGSERERLEAERDEWLADLKSSTESADPDDPRARALHQEYESYINSLNDRINDLGSTEKSFASDTMTVQIDHTGRTAEIAYDPETQEWRNTESGNTFDMERYQKDVVPGFAADAAFIADQRHKLETRDTAFDRHMDQVVAEEKERAQMLGQLGKLRNQSYGIDPPTAGKGDVQANLDKLIGDLLDRKTPVDDLRDRASRVAKVVIHTNLGSTMGEDRARRLIDREMSYTNAAAQTMVEGTRDVIEGRTWAGMAGRAGLAALTGGASEFVLTPAEALIGIKEDIESGETGLRATLKAMGKVVIGELTDRYSEAALGHGLKMTGYEFNPKITLGGTDYTPGHLAERLEKLGNTPVSQAYAETREWLTGRAGKAASGEAAEALTSSAGKRALGNADSFGKFADDQFEHNAFRGNVEEQARTIQGKLSRGESLTTAELNAVQREPSISRELKKMDPEFQQRYQEHIEGSIYGKTDAGTAEALQGNRDVLDRARKEFGPDAKVRVEVDTVRTPQKPGSPPASVVNADRDATARMIITDSQGNVHVRDIDPKTAAPIYQEEFARSSGMLNPDGSFNVDRARAAMPEGAVITDASGRTTVVPWENASRERQLEALAGRHNQEITWNRSNEAAADFDPGAGKYSDREGNPLSNVGALKSGDPSAHLTDPGGLAQMEQYKINNWFNKGETGIKGMDLSNSNEAYEQLSKMGKLTEDLTDAYQKLGYHSQGVPTNMQDALEIVRDRNLSPGTRTARLQELGFDGPRDLANRLSGRIEGLQKLGGLSPTGGTPGVAEGGSASAEALNKVTSAIIGLYQNSDKPIM